MWVERSHATQEFSSRVWWAFRLSFWVWFGGGVFECLECGFELVHFGVGQFAEVDLVVAGVGFFDEWEDGSD